MPPRRPRTPRPVNPNQPQTPETNAPKGNVADIFFNEINDAFVAFDKIPEAKRAELYGEITTDKKYLEQFREYFQKEQPMLLDKIDKKDLSVYLQALADKGFTIADLKIKKKASKLKAEFEDESSETHVIERSLSDLKNFCANPDNKMPAAVWTDFVTMARFDGITCGINPGGALKTVDDLWICWKRYSETKMIPVGGEMVRLKDYHHESIQKILNPNYNPIERVMLTVAITKMREKLKGPTRTVLRAAFDTRFSLPINAFSPYQDLASFSYNLKGFFTIHAAEIDEPLAKSLDAVIVTNGDIQGELLKSVRKFDDTKGFSEREQYYRRLFNKLVTRQLFEEVQETNDTIEKYLTTMGETFKAFPPYVNEILTIHPFNDRDVSAVDTTYHADRQQLGLQIDELERQRMAAATDEEKSALEDRREALKQEREQRKWQAYITYLSTKDASLSAIFAQLVNSKFDFAVLSVTDQQHLVDILVQNKLEDTIKNKVPELLSVSEENMTQFIHDLFDLEKMDLVIPTSNGPVSLSFIKKEFLSSVRTHLPALTDLRDDIKNLPLNFITQLTETNAAFFEDSYIFNSIYTDFVARNNTFRLNDAYKVRIKKGDKTVEGYLSAYCPINEKYNDKDYDGKELFLYTEAITAPNQDRSMVTWPPDANNPNQEAIPVVIKGDEQKLCDLEILDKKINLNGDAFGALIFGYVLGQQSLATTMPPKKEEELEKKIGDLEVYREKAEGKEEETPATTPEEHREDTEQDKFNKEWKGLKGYNFPEENLGFVVGTRLFIPFADSEVPPVESGKAWIQMEITHIDTTRGTFKVRIRGGELRLGDVEGREKELPISVAAITSIRDAFGDDIYKLPKMQGGTTFEARNTLMGSSGIKDLEKYFGTVKLDGSTFKYAVGDYADKEITHFGIYQPKAIGESFHKETGKNILYKIKHNANGTITVSGDPMASNYAKNFPARDMDYATFMLFVKEKGLQPKCAEQIKEINIKVTKDQEVPEKVRGFSINNIIGFFKNGIAKVKDGIKKYDEERTEDLTDILTKQGKLWSNIGGFLSPFSRVSSAFENMGEEYRLDRDNRIWKKVEKWVKYYEDFDYSRLYTDVIEPMLSGKVDIVPHYKIAAILLVHLKKGKGPYAKNLSTTGGDRIGKLLGAKHQRIYLETREKKIRELEQGAPMNDAKWADDRKNQLAELEMRYIVEVMDGRAMGMGDDEKWHFQDKYSKKFCDSLEEAYTGFYKHSTVEEGFTKAKDNNFEFSRVEYFRQLADRPEQALPYLKVMALKVSNDTQRQVFETAVLAGLLSGVFLTMTYDETQKFVQKICRGMSFVPGIFARDIKQQFKMQRLLDLFSDGEFSRKTGYSPNDYSYRINKGPGKFIDKFKDRTDETTENGRSIREGLSKFLSLTGKNFKGKTLIDLYSDIEGTSMDDRLLLKEYIDKTNEKNEEVDADVLKNPTSLLGPILPQAQNIVDKMIKFKDGQFEGTGDEKEAMKKFSENMKNAIPKGPLDAPLVKILLNKFFNRFGERGFSGTQMTDFLKRLKWCKTHKSLADDVLYYSTAGEIISSFHTTPPEELKGALQAWTDFFKSNLDTILQQDVITSCCGGSQYYDDYINSKAIVDPREEASLLLDKEDNYLYMTTFSGEEKKQKANKKRELGDESRYLNKKLYDLADKLYRNCGFTNRFKKGKIKKSSVSTAKATGARINNPEVIEKVRQILEGERLGDGDSDDYGPPPEYYENN